MKLESYERQKQCITLHFDTAFCRIKVIKIESHIANGDYPVEFDNIDIAFSRQKTCISLFTRDDTNSTNLTILVTEVDGKVVNYGHFIGADNTSGANIIGGFDRLFGLSADSTSIPETRRPKISCGIKNENIFAEIRKK